MSRIQLPDWLIAIPPGNVRNQGINRFYIRLAALYASERGTLAELSVVLEIPYTDIKDQVSSKIKASPRTREGIRRVLGDRFVPPEMPDLHRAPKKKRFRKVYY